MSSIMEVIGELMDAHTLATAHCPHCSKLFAAHKFRTQEMNQAQANRAAAACCDARTTQTVLAVGPERMGV